MHKQMVTGNHQIVYAHEIDKETDFDNIILHYNLLRILNFPMLFHPFLRRISLKNDKRFRLFLANRHHFKEAIVLVSEPSVLLSRISARRTVEAHLAKTYRARYWSAVTRRVDMNTFYNDLFELLDSNRMSYRVFFSSNLANHSFVRIERHEVSSYLDSAKITHSPS